MTTEPRLLILETSGGSGRVALARGEAVLQERSLDQARRHARDLAPAVREMLHQQRWKPEDIDALLVSLGPGSYTGLRVGLMAAKAFAYATGCAVLGVETFAAIAWQSAQAIDREKAVRLSVIADAQQEKVYCRQFVVSKGGEPLAETSLQVTPLEEWLAQRPPDAWITGPGVRSFRNRLSGLPIVAEEEWEPRPRSLLRLGLPRFARNERDDVWQLEPIYLRPSSAEEKWDALGRK